MYSLTKATEIFIKHYNIGNQNISYDVLRYNTHKLRHSIGVLETGRNLLIKIKENSNISKETISRAEIVLFLHDIARFYQNNKSRILLNSEFEHGDEGYKIVKDENYDEKICLAIKYHNKFNLDNLYKEKTYIEMNNDDKNETLFLSKLVRDADKLQNMIFEIFNIEGLTTLDSKIKSGDISKAVLDDLAKKVTINRDNIKTYADDIIGVLSWMYDIYFPESFDMLNYYSYFEKIIIELGNLEGVTKESIEVVKQNILNYQIK